MNQREILRDENGFPLLKSQEQIDQESIMQEERYQSAKAAVVMMICMFVGFMISAGILIWLWS